jgi:hypothetical protein
VEEGGALCHAAVVAREFGLAAVIGAHGARARIPHSAHGEVDPQRVIVRLLSRMFSARDGVRTHTAQISNTNGGGRGCTPAAATANPY